MQQKTGCRVYFFIAASTIYAVSTFSASHRFSFRHEYLKANRIRLVASMLGGSLHARLCHLSFGPVFREDIKLETKAMGGSRSSKDYWAGDSY